MLLYGLFKLMLLPLLLLLDLRGIGVEEGPDIVELDFEMSLVLLFDEVEGIEIGDDERRLIEIVRMLNWSKKIIPKSYSE